MKTKVRKGICILTVAAMISGGMQQPVLAGYSETKNQDSLQVKMTPLTKESGVTVTNEDQFMNALKQQQSPITVNANLVIGDEAEQGGRMKPVMIPANTVIEGTQGSSINSRSPIQILGDGVCFRNIELKFSSGTATGSVAHREIFLAGHSYIHSFRFAQAQNVMKMVAQAYFFFIILLIGNSVYYKSRGGEWAVRIAG